MAATLDDFADGVDSCASVAVAEGGGKAPPVVTLERAQQLHGECFFTMHGKFFGYRCIPLKKKTGLPLKCLLCGCLSNSKSVFSAFCSWC